MSIYDRPTKALMADWAKANIAPDQTFSKLDAQRWFADHYPKIKRNGFEIVVGDDQRFDGLSCIATACRDGLIGCRL